MVADPELMSYRELQQMCKANGLSATGKTAELRESLEAHLRSNGARAEAPAANELAYSNSGGRGDSGYRSGDDDGGAGTGARDMSGDEDAYGNIGRRGRREFGGAEDAYGNVGRRGRRDFGGDEDADGNGGGRGGYVGAGGTGARERRDVRRQEQGANVKPGDWTCPNCGASVFASKTRCYKCGTINPDPDARAAAAARSSGRGTPPWHPDSAGKRRDAPGGASWAWQGLEGDESFEVSMEDDEAAFREAFGPARSSGIDFGDKAKDIPVEVELPRKLRNELPPEMAPVAHFDDLACGRVLRRNLGFAGFAQPTPVQSHSMPVALAGACACMLIALPICLLTVRPVAFDAGRPCRSRCDLGGADGLRQDARVHAAHPQAPPRGAHPRARREGRGLWRRRRRARARRRRLRAR
jgi:hypothetical protein